MKALRKRKAACKCLDSSLNFCGFYALMRKKNPAGADGVRNRIGKHLFCHTLWQPAGADGGNYFYHKAPAAAFFYFEEIYTEIGRAHV